MDTNENLPNRKMLLASVLSLPVVLTTAFVLNKLAPLYVEVPVSTGLAVAWVAFLSRPVFEVLETLLPQDVRRSNGHTANHPDASS